MSTGWRIQDVAAPLATIDVDRGAIVITTRNETGDESTDRVVAADIALILLSTGVRFSSGVLHRLAEHDVVMMMCDWRGVPQAVSLPWSEHVRCRCGRLSAKADYDGPWRSMGVRDAVAPDTLEGAAHTGRGVHSPTDR